MTDPKPPSDRDKQQEQEKWYERTRYQILLFAGGIALLGLVLGLILDWYINPQTSAQKKDLVQALGLITAGTAGAVGIFFTWRGQRLNREAQEETQRSTQEQLRNAQEQLTLTRQAQEQNQKATQAQLENAQEELRLTRQGQITERFTRAIDQVGNESLEIRLGGIYALERIARESEEDHWPIMEILTAYVRQHAPRRLPGEGQDGTEDAAVERKSEEDSRGESEPAEVPAPAQDIQAIMTVLRRRARSFRHGEPEPILLHETNLSGADLSGANLQGTGRVVAELKDGITVIDTDSDLQELYTEWSNAYPDAEVTTSPTQEQIEQANGDEDTQLPPHLKPPAHWGVKTDDQKEGT